MIGLIFKKHISLWALTKHEKVQTKRNLFEKAVKG